MKRKLLVSESFGRWKRALLTCQEFKICSVILETTLANPVIEQLPTEGAVPGTGDLTLHKARTCRHRVYTLERGPAHYSPWAKSVSQLFCK